jgi:cyclophilin family peptidyl-prolyl cis-trans isomerase
MAALVASGMAADFELLDRALADVDVDEVRRLAAGVLRTRGGELTPGQKAELTDRALRDRNWQVRLEGVRAYATLPDRDCGPLVDALKDPSDHVVLQALDSLAAPCTGEHDIPMLLVTWTQGLPEFGSWHRQTHALLSLAKRDPDRARLAMPAFTRHLDWHVRLYAARAAAVLKDLDQLRSFAKDDHDNVRQAALVQLRALAGHGADDLYLEALERSDFQLLITASAALEATPRREPAIKALFDALARATSRKHEPSRDARLALLARIRELATMEDASRLEPYLKDFDARVAASAAEIASRLTGRAIVPEPRPLPALGIPDSRSWKVRVTMRWAGAFEIVALPDAAPLTAGRFLARLKAYQGLTFHRVEPTFVLQGGSPGANEYEGADRYWRDEVGLRLHTRGTLGISTRGRDTGDAQIFINLADNYRLTHDYTVFAEVTLQTLPVIDRILEGDVIDKVEVVR